MNATNDEWGCTIEQFNRMHPPTFDGRGDATLAEDWIQDIQEILHVINCTDEQKVLYSAFKLTGEAKRWYTSTQLSCFAAYLIPDEEKKARKFEQGLNEKIYERIVGCQIWNFSELVNKATVFERSLQRSAALLEQRNRTAPQGFQSVMDQRLWKKRNDGSSSGQKQMHGNQSNSLCKFCNRAHTGECRRHVGACFRCGKTRHLIRECPLLLTDNKKTNPHPGPQQTNQGNNQRRMGLAQVFALIAEDAEDENNEITDTSLYFS
ncbi:uncharacterized protein LOC121267189 [Juglans microcarpa x Juglans regia]|uniref:uncharacterized protein LOC121267189 n=1 Tax=Juglans microcarpa x Juglans regia TaxID=2249226 RepID=UPI001B7EBFE4|nr:uncharacterized protein LOC121267189 [Juglans microcarpa x Juglans regia]